MSLRSPSVRDALIDQQYAYSTAQLDPEQTTIRVAEVISKVLVAPESPSLVVQHMADPAIKIVSLTVTEKGYCLSPSTGTLDLIHPDVQHDISTINPESATGFLVRALQQRMRAGHLPFTVLSTMVDRITPATTSNDIDTVKHLTSMSDAAPVVHEPFTQ